MDAPEPIAGLTRVVVPAPAERRRGSGALVPGRLRNFQDDRQQGGAEEAEARGELGGDAARHGRLPGPGGSSEVGGGVRSVEGERRARREEEPGDARADKGGDAEAGAGGGHAGKLLGRFHTGAEGGGRFEGGAAGSVRE